MKRRRENRIKYRAWVRDVKAQYGSIPDYICQERLHWTRLPSSDGSDKMLFEVRNSKPFADSQDYKILWNDWPYGSLEPDVKHLIVWLKRPLDSDSQTGRLLESQRAVVQEFIDRTFIRPMKLAGLSDARDRLKWFKNGFDLQSVGAIDHFHVLLRGVPSELLFQWTREAEPIV